MSLTRQQAAQNRRTILDVASRVFRGRGVDGVGVVELMKEAGFTHGGFYNHFISKQALAAEACAETFEDASADLRRTTEADRADEPGALRRALEAYLSRETRDNPAQGCPTAAFAVDAAREGGAIQAAYAAGIADFVTVLAEHFAASSAAAGTAGDTREKAIETLITLVGAITLARGVGSADEALSGDVLAVARRRIETI